MTDKWQILVNLLQKDTLFEEQIVLIRDLQKRLQSNELKISVLGQFKRGKSSLINAMLGEKLMPVGIVPLTSVVTEIRYAPIFQCEVVFLDGNVKKIAAKELALYCSEQENSCNEKNVETIRLWTPNHPFGNGIVLVDTPGVGSVYKNNTDTTFEHIIHSDAILFLLSVDSPVSLIEKEFLLKVREYAPRLFFVVNKSDIVEEKDLHDFTGFCEKVVGECIESNVSMYPVSAKTGYGIDELVEKLKKILTSSHEKLLNASVNKKLDIVIRQIKGKIDFAEKTSSMSTEELAFKLALMEEKQQKLETFADELVVLAKHHTNKIISPLKNTLCKDTAKMKEELPVMCDLLHRELSSLPRKTFREQFKHRLDGELEKQLLDLNNNGMNMLSVEYKRTVDFLTEKTRETEEYFVEFIKKELNIDYPLLPTLFTVSDRSDFLLQVGVRPVSEIYMELLDYLLPRSISDRRFIKECIRKAEEDIECNLNKMVYNYRYKIQESLRSLCRELADGTEKLCRDITPLINLLDRRREDVSRKYNDKKEYYTLVISKLEKLMED